MLRTAAVSLFSLLAFAACPQSGPTEPPSPATAAPVEKSVRDLLSGYINAQGPDQARTVIEAGSTADFVAALKAKAASCRTAAEAGTAPADCERDPITCGAEKPALTAVVVTAVVGAKADATAVLTPEGNPPLNVRVTLADDNATWKVSAIACP